MTMAGTPLVCPPTPRCELGHLPPCMHALVIDTLCVHSAIPALHYLFPPVSMQQLLTHLDLLAKRMLTYCEHISFHSACALSSCP